MAKALSILQPYAQLVCMGVKLVETRPMLTNYRGELYIHASQGFHRGLRNLCNNYPFREYIKSHLDLHTGAIIGKVNLDACLSVEALKTDNRLGEHERYFGDYSAGRYGWMLSHAVLFDKPIPYKGQLGIWNFDSRIIMEPSHA